MEMKKRHPRHQAKVASGWRTCVCQYQSFMERSRHVRTLNFKKTVTAKNIICSLFQLSFPQPGLNLAELSYSPLPPGPIYRSERRHVLQLCDSLFPLLINLALTCLRQLVPAASNLQAKQALDINKSPLIYNTPRLCKK